jgi:hypothetical protein
MSMELQEIPVFLWAMAPGSPPHPPPPLALSLPSPLLRASLLHRCRPAARPPHAIASFTSMGAGQCRLRAFHHRPHPSCLQVLSTDPVVSLLDPPPLPVCRLVPLLSPSLG